VVNPDGARYAIYYAPETGSPLAHFGAAWLGYDAATGAPVPSPALREIDPEQLRAITAEPRNYGFHATLKAPFAPASDTAEPAFLDAVAEFAAAQPAFAAPPLRLTRLGGFLALTLSEPCAGMDALAAACVTQLDRFRAPLSAADLERRRRSSLSPRQDQLLEMWGYPYVFEEYRFHLTLTGRLDADEGAAISRALTPLVAPFCQAPLPVDQIAVFHQENRGAPFRILQRYRLAR
jgi:putative phosphonate metabolism protein